MMATLALLALLIELMLGYPDRLLHAIGHPVTWMGRLIDALDRGFNRERDSPARRRLAGAVTVLILIAVVGAIAFLVESILLRLPFGLVLFAFSASGILAERSLTV